MSSEEVKGILVELERWPWQRPVSPLAAAAAMRSVVRRGITDSRQIVAVSCHVIVWWSAVYDLHEVPDAGGIPAAALRSAVQHAGQDVAQDALESLLDVLGQPECVNYDLFIMACAFAQLLA
ncbi:hypothetical protein HPB50_001507 [Hyalomma asiaticum]|uniref:Uncharacterized protein n=1 Tax=Hyalomma asiaticum TaxID=266040 RepID=A0ACB7T5F7_HYAAI|nr:hypothetical protein HPB50_001507 [Hyalomma asiaticum]